MNSSMTRRINKLLIAPVSSSISLLQCQPTVSTENSSKTSIVNTNSNSQQDEKRPLIHSTAEISEQAVLGLGTQIWNSVQVRERARIGSNCIIGKGCYIDFEVEIGDNCKLQNYCCVYQGVRIENGVFLGPGVILTNDKLPRAINPDLSLKKANDWIVGTTLVKMGASIGARAVVLPDLVIGKFAMVSAGAVVTRSVPDHAVVIGNPARISAYACRCGTPLKEHDVNETEIQMWCNKCEQGTVLAAPEVT